VINLAERSKKIRKKFGLNTQQELANILKCSVGKIKAYEQGNTLNFKSADMQILKNTFKLNQTWLEDGTGEMLLVEALLKDIDDMAFVVNNHLSDDAKEIISLLPYASADYISQVIKKLKQYQELSES